MIGGYFCSYHGPSLELILVAASAKVGVEKARFLLLHEVQEAGDIGDVAGYLLYSLQDGHHENALVSLPNSAREQPQTRKTNGRLHIYVHVASSNTTLLLKVYTGQQRRSTRSSSN